MTTIYKKDRADNVTLLEVGKNVILGIRTEEKDGYSAVQVGLEKEVKGNKAKDKVKKGPSFEYIREFRVEDTSGFEKDKEMEVDQFEEGEKIIVSSISKGKGYQGVVKRHNFAGSPASHGHRHDLRAPGSIGSAFPERVMKGKRMAGRMGTDSVTMKNIIVSMVDKEKGIIALRGPVSGTNGTLVMIKALV